MASPSSSAASAPPWVILGRIAAIARHDAIEDRGGLSAAALDLEQHKLPDNPERLPTAPAEQHEAAEPERLSVPALVQDDAVEGSKDFPVALSLPRCVSTRVQPKPALDDTDNDKPFAVSANGPMELFVSLAKPPRVSALTLVRSGGARQNPYVVAADDGGLLLHVARFDVNGKQPQGVLFVANIFVPGDAGRNSARATAIRTPDPPAMCNMANVGLIFVPESGGAEFMVADLRLMDDDRATLFTIRSGADAWLRRSLSFPSSCGQRRMLISDDVITHEGKLWWVNLERGLLICDPCTDEPVLWHVKFPEAFNDNRKVLLPSNLGRVRMVRVSQAKLRYVVIERGVSDPVEEILVVIWSLEFCPGGKTRWERQSSSIWASESFMKSGLPKDVPELALLHPSKPDLVYFFVGDNLFSFNISESRVKEITQKSDHDQLVR